MTLRDALLWGTERLQSAGIASASLDAEILLALALKITKEKLFAHPKRPVSRLRLAAYRTLICRRAKHAPVAYLIGHKEFYGLDFFVDRRVLIPRPETELMVDEILKLLPTRYSLPATLVDVGTGSGCIVISLAKLLTTRPQRFRLRGGRARSSLPTHFFATDTSPAALKLTKQNAKRHGVNNKITFLRGNLLDPFLRDYTLHATPYTLCITANLPYLPTAEWREAIPEVKKYEPRLALDGGPDGLKYYRELFRQLKTTRYSLPATHLFLEICPHQTNAIKTLARFYFPDCKTKIKKDLAGLNRLAIINIKHSHYFELRNTPNCHPRENGDPSLSSRREGSRPALIEPGFPPPRE